MRIRLLKRWANEFDSYRMGTILNLSNGYAKRLIAEGTAEAYAGSYPPRGRSEKLRTDFFKPKHTG